MKLLFCSIKRNASLNINIKSPETKKIYKKLEIINQNTIIEFSILLYLNKTFISRNLKPLDEKGIIEKICTNCKSMSEEKIENGYIKTLNLSKLTIIDMASSRQDLTFDEFKMILSYKHFHYNELSFDLNFSLSNGNRK